MPARKPVGLNVRHDVKADVEEREAAEAALSPRKKLPVAAPAALRGHAAAAREWRRVIGLYNGLEAEIVSRLDMGMLTDYCMLMEQMDELDELRAGALEEWKSAKALLDRFQKQLEDDPDEKVDLKTFTKAVEAVNWAFDKVVKIDGRVDRKRALILSLRQSLYLTPRSRAGVAPQKKTDPEPVDELTALLNA